MSKGRFASPVSLSHLFRKRQFWFYGCAVCLIVILSTMMIFPRIQHSYAASATLSVNPNSHADNATSTIGVQGTNYAPNEKVTIYWNYTGPGTGTQLVTATTGATGMFTGQINLPIAAYGTYTIAGVGQTSGMVATAPFQLFPLLHVNPSAAGVGSSVTFTGHGYGAGESVNILWNYTGVGTGSLMKTIVADSTGSFQTSARIPASTTYGMTNIAGIGQTTNQEDNCKFVMYKPMLALAPLRGSVGTKLTLSAYGFQKSETAKIYWNNSSTPVLLVPTTISGYLSPTVFTIPAGTVPGGYPVKIIGSQSHLSLTQSFTVVSPALSMNITSGPIGATVNVQGQGYTPQETVTLYWNYTGSGTGTSVGSIVAGIDGSLSGSFVVPVFATGPYTLAATGATSNSVTSGTFTITNSIAVNAITAAPGQNVTVTGTGFQANEAVQLSWDTTSGTLLKTVNADGNGNISQVVSIPAGALQGSHTIVGVGQSSGVSFNTTITIDTAWTDFGFTDAHNRQNSSENTVNVTNVANLHMKWSANIGSQPEGAPSPIYSNGMVYIATLDGYLRAYNATTGAIVWQYNTGTGYSNLSSPVIDSATNTLFFGTLAYLQDQDLGIPSPTYALDAKTGALKWSEIIPGDDYGFPTIAFHTIYVGFADEGNGSLLAIDEASGYLDWQYKANGGVWGAVGVDESTHTVFSGVGNPGDQVVAFNPVTGNVVWSYAFPHYGIDDDIGTAIAVANGMLYVNSKNGNFYALNDSTGTVTWSTQVGVHSIGNVSSPAIGSNGVVYVASLNGYVYAFDASKGTTLWKKKIGQGLYSSPALANGVLYVASNDQKFYAVNAATGAILWSYTTGGETFSSPILVNGWLYCASADGNLYAFSL